MDKRTILIAGMALLIVMNTLSFALMGIDKRRARQRKWRISEKTLFLTTALFGGVGGVLGMRMFHHKTHHWYFRVFFPVFLVLQIIAIGAGLYFLFR